MVKAYNSEVVILVELDSCFIFYIIIIADENTFPVSK